MPAPHDATLAGLEQAARQAAASSYSPYSDFAVGAALLTESGQIITGCNVENASYGLSLCAERVAVGRAVADGHRRFAALALFTPTETPVPPCGACLQVLLEFAPELHISAVCQSDARLEGDLKEFLPRAFTGRHLHD